ncbi:response regulator transcription factor [Dysgonomonas macrotermitis]|uniref:DNA-binding response regulator, OmpR family, contains REC and winged-helix (WHTH) domain n=1 Tax=Dysgonomonas macrotermitis TaxID=1346286 RepID=A0A1M4ZVP7_9BACT|nr:response regulator transcription factor [Dysgonomonas macrotermitis]SHF22098.1 DNA-binding response regulator, OmpR family, contains REC and winged-helix (wHTH) domain [Dysgonomonas macrotermitis]
MKLLLVEDEIDLQESIVTYLQSEGFAIETASTYPDGEEKVSLYNYDCLIIDITLPGGTGLDLIRLLKEKDTDAGVIIISAKNSLDDKLVGLDIGADDYLTKPFHLSELNARIKSIIRRRNFKGGNSLEYKEITIFFDGRKVTVLDKELILTKKEYDLLLYFITNQSKVMDKEAIAEHLWGDNMSLVADSYDFIYTHIKNLRKKLIDAGSKDYIHTVYGIGYQFGER